MNNVYGLKPKDVCDLISTVANAIATDTIEEATEYLIDKFNGEENPILEHTFQVLNNVKQTKQYER